MLVLAESAPSAVPVPLGKGAVIFVRPATSAEYFLAQARVVRLAAGIAEGEDSALKAALILGEEFANGSPRDPEWIAAVSERMILVELAIACADKWAGIGTKAGKPLEMSPATLAMLLRDPECARKIQNVINSGIHSEVEEKKELAASPVGAAPAADLIAPIVEQPASLAPTASPAVPESPAPK
jgi:hypothetical protein